MDLQNQSQTADKDKAADALVGQTVADHYKLLELIGKGPTGSVYKARHDLMDRTVAVKILPPELIKDETTRKRFEREALAVGKVAHANIIAVHDVGMTANNSAYIVMDYLEGQTLEAAVKQHGQLGVVRALPIFLQICDALQQAHKAGIVHRDLKPANIMLVNQADLEDFVKVVDFGMSKVFSESEKGVTVSAPGNLFGDPGYISPEQAVGDAVDARSDVYSLGCVLYKALTGKQPFTGKTPLEVAKKHKTERAKRFSEVRPDLYIPDWLEAAVFKAMEKDRDDRFQTMQEFFDCLLAGANAASSQQQRRKLSTSLRTVGINDEPSVNTAALNAGNRSWRKSTGIKVVLVAAGALFVVIIAKILPLSSILHWH